MFKQLVLGATLLIYCTGLRGARWAATPQKTDNGKYRATDEHSSGIIMVTILDQSGAVASGVHVRLTNGDQSATQEVVSGENGQFSFSNVPSGAFHLTVNSANFATEAFSG